MLACADLLLEGEFFFVEGRRSSSSELRNLDPFVVLDYKYVCLPYVWGQATCGGRQITPSRALFLLFCSPG